MRVIDQLLISEIRKNDIKHKLALMESFRVRSTHDSNILMVFYINNISGTKRWRHLLVDSKENYADFLIRLRHCFDDWANFIKT